MNMQKYDAIVVGGGATGTFAVDELTQQGLNVLLLEAGDGVKSQDFAAKPSKKKKPDINILERAVATLKGQPIQSKAAFFSGQFSHLYVKDTQDAYTTPKGEPYLWIRGKQLGGRLHTFGRVLLRWTDDDFKIHSQTGVGVDWPFSYTDIEPYYAEVEKKVGLIGTVDDVKQLPDGEYSAKAEFTDAESVFKESLESVSGTRHVVPWRYMLPQKDKIAHPFQAALETKRLTVKVNAMVKKVLTNDEGTRAIGVEVIDRKTNQITTYHAKAVVLTASPIESIRLLLNSATNIHPTGLGNHSGNLGKYFMDQLPCIAMGSFPKVKGVGLDKLTPIDDFYGHSGGVFIPKFDGDDPLLGDYNFQGTVGRNSVDAGLPSRLSFFGFGRMQPSEDNRVTLSNKTDKWGMPLPHIRCVMSAQDRALLSRQNDAIVNSIEIAGGKLEFIGSPLGLAEKGAGAYPNEDAVSRLLFRKLFKQVMVMGAAIHETGGARMGNDANSSVLNAYNQVWGIPNLCVTDASCFVSSGIAGTTLTGMALTVRACRQLASLIKNGEL